MSGIRLVNQQRFSTRDGASLLSIHSLSLVPIFPRFFVISAQDGAMRGFLHARHGRGASASSPLLQGEVMFLKEAVGYAGTDMGMPRVLLERKGG